MRTGWGRLALVVGTLVVGVLTAPVLHQQAQAFLPWFDRLAPKPGLSGLLLLGLSPILFLAAASLVAWVWAGFANRGDAAPGGPQQGRQ